MTNLKQIMSAAWTAARQGAATFGGSARSYIAEALKAAWAKTKAPKPVTLEDIAAEMNKRLEVYQAKVWNGRRVYVNFVGFNARFAGDKNAKCFYDPKLGWVIEGLKGTMSSDFSSSIKTFAREFCWKAFWNRDPKAV